MDMINNHKEALNYKKIFEKRAILGGLYNLIQKNRKRLKYRNK